LRKDACKAYFDFIPYFFAFIALFCGMIKSKTFCCFLFILSFVNSVIATVQPKDSALLHYTRVFFEENFVENAVSYQLHVFSDEASMISGKTIIAKTYTIPAFTVSDLNWGTTYYWKISAFDDKKNIIREGTAHQFSIIPILKNNNILDFKIKVNTNKTDKHLGGLIAIDYAKLFCDRNGKAVWVIPEVVGLHSKETQVRDLRYTDNNTVTFLSNGLPLEIDYDGNLLWKLPHPFVFGTDTITFHHTFAKVKDHYFVLGNKNVFRSVHQSDDQKVQQTHRDIKVNDTLYRKIEVGVLLEFDRSGKVVWYWDANDYLKDVDLNFKKAQPGVPNMASHANGFNLNADLTKVYLSFRDLSRVIRIDKKTGKVDISYGEKYPSGDAQFGDGMFVQQHDPNPTTRKTILLFNNNGARNKATSSIVEIRDKGYRNDSLLVWKFSLDFDTLTNGKSISGGNVMELPNGNVFLAAGYLNRIFEITRKKEIVWDAFLFCKNSSDTSWQKFPQYRARWFPKISDARFIIQTKKLTKNGNLFEQIIAIHNFGNTNDQYEITVLDGDKIVKKQKTAYIKPTDKSQQTISFKTNNMNTNTLKIEVRAMGASNRVQTLSIE